MRYLYVALDTSKNINVTSFRFDRDSKWRDRTVTIAVTEDIDPNVCRVYFVVAFVLADFFF